MFPMQGQTVEVVGEEAFSSCLFANMASLHEALISKGESQCKRSLRAAGLYAGPISSQPTWFSLSVCMCGGSLGTSSL